MKIAECNRNAKPGEIITFGTYPQTADGADRTPIKWRVLQNSGSELFVLSEYILDTKQCQNPCGVRGKSARFFSFTADGDDFKNKEQINVLEVCIAIRI